jgi:hypothetical protein
LYLSCGEYPRRVEISLELHGWFSVGVVLGCGNTTNPVQIWMKSKAVMASTATAMAKAVFGILAAGETGTRHLYRGRSHKPLELTGASSQGGKTKEK